MKMKGFDGDSGKLYKRCNNIIYRTAARCEWKYIKKNFCTGFLSYLGLYVKKLAPGIKKNNLTHPLLQIPGYATGLVWISLDM